MLHNKAVQVFRFSLLASHSLNKAGERILKVRICNDNQDNVFMTQNLIL